MVLLIALRHRSLAVAALTHSRVSRRRIGELSPQFLFRSRKKGGRISVIGLPTPAHDRKKGYVIRRGFTVRGSSCPSDQSSSEEFRGNLDRKGSRRLGVTPRGPGPGDRRREPQCKRANNSSNIHGLYVYGSFINSLLQMIGDAVTPATTQDIGGNFGARSQRPERRQRG